MIILETMEKLSHQHTDNTGITLEQPSFRDSITTAITNYFDQLEGEEPCALYELVLNEVEVPLLEKVLEYTEGNQSKAANVLGLNRGTLRKKLRIHGIY